jgi:hypothetical protein
MMPSTPLAHSVYTCYHGTMTKKRSAQDRSDRRSITSRAKLGDHVPAPLGGGESQVLTVRVPAELAAELEAEVARSGLTRSDIVRWCLEYALPESRKVPPYEPW